MAGDNFKDRPLGDDVLGGKRPSLKPESLNGDDAAVLTIKDVELVELKDDDAEDGIRKAVRLDFEEVDLPYWPNKTGLRTISEKYGQRPRDWMGEKVALVVVTVNNPQTKRQQKALHVAQGEEFDELVDQSSSGRRRVKKAKKAAGRGKR